MSKYCVCYRKRSNKVVAESTSTECPGAAVETPETSSTCTSCAQLESKVQDLERQLQMARMQTRFDMISANEKSVLI
jgi:hypothetical protein